ncbi:MAG: hypothetical protein PGN24_10860 [Microbacterium arborescens]
MPDPNPEAAHTAGPVVGVDVGGTKTHIVASNGATSIDVVIPSPTWRHGSLFDDVANFDRLSAAVTRAVGAPPRATVVGAHGVDNAEQRVRATALLGERLAGSVEVVNDAVLLAPAMGRDSAICVIAGTGSIVVGVGASGEPIAADGHGWLIADDASAPGLARGAVLAVLRAVDRGGPAALADPLARTLLDAVGASDHVELALRFQAGASEESWGSLAPRLFEAVAAGSPLARTVVERAAAHLADLVVAVRERGARGSDVIAAGGVMTAQPALATGLRTALAERDGSLSVSVLDTAPAWGALELARRLADSATPSSAPTRPVSKGTP